MTDIGQPHVNHMAISMHELTVDMTRLRGYGTMTRSDNCQRIELHYCLGIYDHARFKPPPLIRSQAPKP
jgi:hypothetical protein